jgi:hypothetical protein
MPNYTYNGPVYNYNECLVYRYNVSTVAQTPTGAISNLESLFKREHGLLPECRISFPGEIIEN